MDTSSSASMLNVSRLALEDGKNISEEVYSQIFSLMKQLDIYDQIYTLPHSNTDNGSNSSPECANRLKID